MKIQNHNNKEISLNPGKNILRDSKFLIKKKEATSKATSKSESSAEKMFKWIFYIYICFCIFLIICVHSIEQKSKTKRFSSSNIITFLLVIPGFLFSLGLFNLCEFIFGNFIRKYASQTLRKNETQKNYFKRIQKMFFTIIYYSISSLVCFIFLLKFEKKSLPKYMGGNLKTTDFIDNWPHDISPYVIYFFIFSLGHHIERTFNHYINNRHSSNFWILIFHHTLTSTIMIYCYGARCLILGIPILVIHDITNITAGMIRVVREIKIWKKHTISMYFMFLWSWVYFRIFIFDYEIIIPLIKDEVPKVLKIGNYLFIVGLIGICLLAFLNTFWLFLILNSGYNKIFKKIDFILFENEKSKTE